MSAFPRKHLDFQQAGIADCQRQVGSLSMVYSRATFPILSRDPYFQKTINNPGKQLVFEKNDG